MKNEKLWSLKISIKKNFKDKDIQNYFKICKEKLGLIPNILKTNTIDKKKFDAFNIFYNRLMQDDNYLSKIEKITKQLNIITVGIGSSANCDGQVLVIDDLIGLSQSKFRFVKKYANVNQMINLAVKRYKSEVLKKQFPKAKHSFKN